MRSCLYPRSDNALRGVFIRKVTAASVGRLARRKGPENWAFREHLKGPGNDPGEVDRLVQELYRQASAEFDCKACANCCREVSPLLDDEDVARLSRGLGVPAGRLIADHLARDEAYGGFVFREMPCPFLEDDRCSCYQARPHDCRSYPHLHKDGFTRRLSNTVANCSICPIVYTVYERLKGEMGRQLK